MRAAILERVGVYPRTTRQLAAAVGLPLPAVAVALRALERAGLVRRTFDPYARPIAYWARRG